MRTCRSLVVYGEIVIYYCTHCWKGIAKEQKICSHCGADQSALSRKTFVQKLIQALHHPEPETPIRAAYVFGHLKAADAVGELVLVLCASPDPYIAAACAEALGKIGGTLALEALHDALKIERSVIVRRAVLEALEHHPQTETPS